ncbi:MAG TPA: dephospho-CoA kinase [Chlamydiales bacterium]|jgi:dephospho-CoA kinase
MLTLRKIAVTGGLASGKSAVCRFLRQLGAFVVSSDEIVHQLLSSSTDLIQQVTRLLGSHIVKNGAIDRREVAQTVFKKPELLSQLEKILHPAVLEEIERRYKQACQTEGQHAFVVEIPLLFEIGAETFYDVVIAVIANEQTAKERFIASGHFELEYNERMKRQLSNSIKSAKANYTLTNNGTLDDLQKKTEQLYNLITKK